MVNSALLGYFQVLGIQLSIDNSKNSANIISIK